MYQPISINRITCVMVLSCILLVPILRQPAASQSIFGTIVGTVSDPTGAVIPGAKVTAVNVGTNESRAFLTNEFGTYELNNLFPGVYFLEAEMPGFAKYRQENIQLAANQNIRANFTLQLTASATDVTVLAQSGTIETENAKLSDVRTTMQLRELPLADRSIYRFLVLTPGVTGGGADGTMSVSGSRQRQEHYAVDGVTMSDVRSSNTIGPTLNFIESFEEAKIDFGNNSAEFKAIGTLTMVSRRGGNQVHGAMYDYYSTGAFRAADYFTHARLGTPNHAFGGHIGGPVYLPKLYDGRNKTFFLAAYETTFAPQGADNLTPTVPLAPWKQGKFSGLATPVLDPFAGGVPFPDNVIPADRISNAARQYLGFWPDPNYGNPNTFATSNYRGLALRPFAKPHNAQFRGDHHLSDKNTVFGRYLHQRQQNPTWESGLPSLSLRQQLRVVKHFLVSDTHVFSPTLINETRFGISFNTNPYYPRDLNGKAFIQKAGLTNVTRDGTIPDVHDIPNLTFSQGAGIQSIQPINERYYNEDLTYQWQDTVSKISGKHSIRTGVEINEWFFKDQNQQSNVLGQFDFTGRYTGFNFADFLLGIPSSMSRSPYAVYRQDKSVGYDFFFQDNYKVSSSLTLNLGLRYELHLPWNTSGGRLSAFDVASGSIVVPDRALPLVSPLFPTNLVPVIGNSKTQFNDTLMKTDKNNFAPRFGLAWRPFGPTFVVRAGYGIFYEIIPQQTTRFGAPFVVSEPTYTNPSDVSNPGFVQWPLAFPASTGSAGVSIPGTIQLGYETPYAQNWNVTLEKEIGLLRLRASYVGTGGRKMLMPFNINQPAPGPGLYVDKPRPFPNLPDITINVNGASHTYHAMNLQLERSFNNGFLLNSALTWAKDLGNEQLTAYTPGTPENAYDWARERGPTQAQAGRRWIGFFIYQLPIGPGKRFGSGLKGVAGQALSGWELSASSAIQDGQHETPLWQTADIQGTAYTTSRTPASVMRRPDCVADPNLPRDQRTIGLWYNVNAFVLPYTPGVFGTCGRGIVDGPGVKVLHGGLYKRIKVERFEIRFGMQATNILNHPNWGNLSSGALRLDNASGRGKITDASGATPGSAGDAAGPRSMRLDLRVEF